jgi:hypothetical protein
MVFTTEKTITLKMKKNILFLYIIICCISSYSQIKELDDFRQHQTDFITYDKSEEGKSEVYLQKLRVALESSFRKFVLLKDFSSIVDAKEFEGLKIKANTNSMKYLYSFFELRSDYTAKTAKNNINYYIGFFGLYDYASPNIISIYMQPHSIGTENYMIYYYKMNNKGTYFIKSISSNEIVYEGEALTSNAPIVKFDKLDSSHYLIVEDMGDYGQRALVLKVDTKKWKSIDAFKGKSFDIATLNYEFKKDIDKRKYLWIASNLKITKHLKDRPFELSWISFDDRTKNISFRRYTIKWLESQKVTSTWDGNFFSIDDYFIGEDYK